MIRLYLKISEKFVRLQDRFWVRLVHFIIILLFWEFFTPVIADDLRLQSEWQQVSYVPRTLLSILDDLNNVVVRMVTTRSLLSKSSSPCTNSLVTVQSTPITIGITVIFMFHCFFSSLARSRYLSHFSLSFSVNLWSAGTSKPTIRQVHFFCWLSLGLVVWLRLDDSFLSQNHEEIFASHFLEQILGFLYTTYS